jgi:hypothetical protein
VNKLHRKLTTADRPHEVWIGHGRSAGWTWKVLKKYSLKENPFDRWFCHVSSPMLPEGELGDVYVSEIKSNANLESLSA